MSKCFIDFVPEDVQVVAMVARGRLLLEQFVRFVSVPEEKKQKRNMVSSLHGYLLLNFPRCLAMVVCLKYIHVDSFY